MPLLPGGSELCRRLNELVEQEEIIPYYCCLHSEAFLSHSQPFETETREESASCRGMFYTRGASEIPKIFSSPSGLKQLPQAPGNCVCASAVGSENILKTGNNWWSRALSSSQPVFWVVVRAG